MMPDPVQRMLGLPADADARTLLGLGVGDVDAVQIDSALRDRLARVFQHPEGRSAEADLVRRKLRTAAEELRRAAEQRTHAALRSTHGSSRSMARPAATTMFNLTAFDRLVLAVLVACGGWNARSRAQLVALAAAYGITVHGLIRVVQGLSQYARSGGARLGVHEITAGKSLAQYMPPTPSGTPVGPAMLDKITANLSAELKRDDPWPTIKLAAIFGIITLIAGIIAIRILVGGGESPARSGTQVAATDQHVADAPPTTATPAQPQPQRTVDERPRIATWPIFPTFLGTALPAEAINESRACPDVPQHLDEIERKLIVEDSPSEAVFKHWEAAIHTVSTGWLLCDASTRQHIDRKLYAALRAGGNRPEVSDRLLNALITPTTLNEPIALWRGAWMVGMQARIAHATPDDGLPPLVVQRARAILQTSLPGAAPGQPLSFEAAATVWLDQRIPQLVAVIETDDRAYDFWELWLAAQRGLGRGERHNASIMRALAAIVHTHADLARPGPMVNVAARLLDVAIQSPSTVVLEQLQQMFDDPEITARDLWVITSLLAMSDAAQWFPDRLVVPDDADQRHRWRVSDDLASLWPASSNDEQIASGAPRGGLAQAIDSQLLQRWTAQVEQALTRPLSQQHPSLLPQEALLQELILASRLIEVADALVTQRADHAGALLDVLENPVPITPAAPMPPPGQGLITQPPKPPRAQPPTPSGITQPGTPRPTQPVAADGGWAAEYEAARSPEEKINLLRLLGAAHGDLGVHDASILVREAYRGTPQEVRTLAQDIVQQFIQGPNVSQAMLDHFADGAPNEALSRTIENFTAQSMPEPRSSDWKPAARIALVNHLLALKPDAHNQIDALANELVESYISRVTLLRREGAASIAPPSPQDAAEELVQYWLETAETSGGASVPDTLPGLNRRRLVRQRLIDGPIQSMVASQLAILDLLAYITVAEQPAQAAAVQNMLRAAADARLQAVNVLEQAVLAERAVLRLWRLRLQSATPAQAAMHWLPPRHHALAEDDFSPRRKPGAEDTRHGATSSEIIVHPRLALAAASLMQAETDRGNEHAATAAIDWTDQLEALHPAQPLAYFELAEEIAETATDDAQRALARHLFGLAGVLDQQRLGRSACLALADLEPNPAVKRHLLALASLLGAGFSSVPEPSTFLTRPQAPPQSTVLALCDALGYYRRGQGARAMESLRKPGVMDLLQRYEHHLPGSSQQIIDDCKNYRGQARPTLAAADLVRMLRLELALLSGESRSWSSDLLLHSNLPLIEVDPARLHEIFGVDGSKPFYRNGRWVERSQ